MRKIVAFCFFLCLCCIAVSGVSATSDYIDISQMSEAELLELRSSINIRLAEFKEDGDILYDDKDISIKWLGFDTGISTRLKNSLLITNKTNKSLFYEITKVAYNGIQVSANNSMRSPEIEGGFSYLTSTNNLYLIDTSGLETVGIKSINDISDVYFEVSFFMDGERSAKAIKECKLRFVVD